MPRLWIFSDRHNDARALEKLMAIEADYYFAAGDLVSWARGLDKMAEPMKRRAEHMYVLPGNHESEGNIADFCDRYGFINFHGGAPDVARDPLPGPGHSQPPPSATPRPD